MMCCSRAIAFEREDQVHMKRPALQGRRTRALLNQERKQRLGLTRAHGPNWSRKAAALPHDGFYFNHKVKDRNRQFGERRGDRAYHVHGERAGTRGITLCPFEVSYPSRAPALRSTLWFPIAIPGGAGVETVQFVRRV